MSAFTKERIDRLMVIFEQFVAQSLNRDDITVAEVDAAIKAKMLTLADPFEAEVFMAVLWNNLFTGSDVQMNRRKSGEIDLLKIKVAIWQTIKWRVSSWWRRKFGKREAQ